MLSEVTAGSLVYEPLGRWSIMAESSQVMAAEEGWGREGKTEREREREATGTQRNL